MRVHPTIVLVMLAVGTVPATPEMQTTPLGQQPRVAVMVLRPHGFEPADIQVGSGRTLLTVYNRTGLQEVFLRLERETPQGNQRIQEERLPLGKRNWRALVDLTPGRYWVTEANHLRWVARLTVVPSQK